ncbi:hypothetical protein PMIN06_011260 [Paraphaeosphaeria minitans]
MAPHKKRASSSLQAPVVKRRRDELDTNPQSDRNAALPAPCPENLSTGALVLPAEVIDNFWATFNKKNEEDDDDEVDDEDQEDEKVEAGESSKSCCDNKDEGKQVEKTSPVVELPKSIRSYKPTSARCPVAAVRKATSNSSSKTLDLEHIEHGPSGSQSRSGIPSFVAVSGPSKEVQSPFANTPKTSTEEPEDKHRTAIEVEAGVSPSHIDVSRQDVVSSNPAATVPVMLNQPSFTPFSHKPIYLNEPGHGQFKSRLVFEADGIPHDQLYEELVHTNNRMTALQKLKVWRQTLGGKSKDGQVRKAKRLVILNEGVPSMARNELSLYTDTLKGLGSWMKHFMPDSFIVIKTAIPANSHTVLGRFRAYMDALFQLLERFPFHFSVQIEDKSILAMRITDNTQDSVPEELAFACNFVNSVEFFRQHGHFWAGDQKPFLSLKPAKKRNKTIDGSFDPDREAKIVADWLPWIPEQYARDFYAACIAYHNMDLGHLECTNPGLNPEALTPQESVDFVASMNRSLFVSPIHPEPGHSYRTWDEHRHLIGF